MMGVYTITNIINKKAYVGYSSNVYYRLLRHLSSLRRNCHDNIYLQYSWNKYGEENFEFEILEEYPEHLLVAMEHYWCTILDVHNPERGYNIKPTHPYNPAARNSKETREKISIKAKGRKPSIETRAKMSQNSGMRGRPSPLRGTTKSKEFKDYISKINKKPKSEEHKRKIREAVSRTRKAQALPVYQYSLDKELIKKWDNTIDAKNFYNCTVSLISQAAIGKIRQAKNFRWSYEYPYPIRNEDKYKKNLNGRNKKYWKLN